MTSDEERREVARRLREAIGLHEFAEVLGFDWTDDSDWGWNDVSSLVADLIEPNCDRDALLALADEIEEGDVTYLVSTQYVLDDYARRIREALGVEP